MRLNRRFMLGVLPMGLFLLTPTGTAASPPSPAQSPAVPDGWVRTESNGATIFRPESVPAGKICFIMVFAEEPLGGKSFAQWFNIRIDTILAKSGTLIRRGKVQQDSSKSLTCKSQFSPTPDQQLVGLFTAASPRPGYGRLLMMTTDADAALRGRYKAAVRAIMRNFIVTTMSPSKEPEESTSGGAPLSQQKDSESKKKDGAVPSGA